MLSLANPCADDETVCNAVYDATDNQALATIADWLIGKPLAVTMIILVGLVIRWLLHRVVDRVVRQASEGGLGDKVSRFSFGKAAEATEAQNAIASARRTQRAQTMGDLLKSIITGLLVAIIGTMVLSEVGVNIAPIIASAGIVGVAIGFGAQSLVKDFFSGIFMIVEDQFGVGDVVDVGEAIGTIEAVTLRVTRLRSLDGTVWYVPNGEILRVGNLSQNWSRAVIDVGIAYDSDIVHAKKVLAEVGESLWDDDDFRDLLIEQPEVTGVEGLGADSVDLRIMVKTAPLQNWAVARELRQRIKARFDAEGIEIPFAQRVVWHRDETAAAAEVAAKEARDGDDA